MESGETYLFLLVVAAGAFSLLGGLKDWDWFMNHRKAQFIINLLGREKTRLFYMIFGSAIMVFGLAGFFTNGTFIFSTFQL